MTLPTLEQSIHAALTSTASVDWFILRKLNRPDDPSDEAHIILWEGERIADPFLEDIGYIELGPDQFPSFLALFKRLLTAYGHDSAALSNLFIIGSRVSLNHESEQIRYDTFKHSVEYPMLVEVYKLLMASLNSGFYTHNGLDRERPEIAQGWKMIFHISMNSAETHGILWEVVCLLFQGDDDRIPFDCVRLMKPLIRGILVGFWGLAIWLNDQDIISLGADPYELSFVTAYIIDRYNSRHGAPPWINDELIERMFAHWQSTGSYLLEEVLGKMRQNISRERTESKLETLIIQSVSRRVKVVDALTKDWINQWLFPWDYLGVFECLRLGRIDPNELEPENGRLVLAHFLDEIENTIRNLPQYLEDKNQLKTPRDWAVYDDKFRYVLAYLFLLFLYCGDDETDRRLRDCCYEINFLYYGSYKTEYYAVRLSQTVLLFLLSGNRLSSIEDGVVKRFDWLQDIVIKSILTPYVHTAEREEEIWNPEYEGVRGLQRSDDLVVNDALNEVKQHAIYPKYYKLFEAMTEIAVATWPYMDGRDVPKRVTHLGGSARITPGK